MYNISVATKKGTKVADLEWKDGMCLVGRSKANNIVLQGWKVANVHAEIDFNDGEVCIRATREGKVIIVNGEKHQEYPAFVDGDVLKIVDYELRVKSLKSQKGERKSSDRIKDEPLLTEVIEACGDSDEIIQEQLIPVDSVTLVQSEKELERTLWRKRIQKEVHRVMDLRRVNISEMDDEQLRTFTKGAIEEIIENQEDFPATMDKLSLVGEILAESVGLGPLENLLDNEDVSEIMVNARDEIFYEEGGKLKISDITFSDDRSVLAAIERIVAPLGRRIDESSPMVDARLKDGSRVNAVIPPLALKGPSITIRKFMKNRLVAGDLVNFGSISPEMVEFLETAIVRKRNVVISGGTGSGKTTLLNVLSNYIPEDERIVTVEDAAELKLHQPNLVSLEARPPNQEGKGAVHIRDLVKNCLRMRPDRIVVGECRGGEALDMLQAMNTGHDGSLTTIHSNSPRDCISRTEVLVLMSGMDLPVKAIREQIASAVHIIVQQTRFSCGSRKVTSITEVAGVEGEIIQLSEIFKFQQTGYNEKGKVEGKFVATGLVPEFYEDLRRKGISVNMSIFNDGNWRE